MFRGLALAVIGAAVLVIGAACGGGTSSSKAPIPSGDQVQSFELPDVVSGRQVSLADDLGKRDIVLVGYMGFFCPGCEQLLVELQSRQGEFQSKAASLIVLGSRPESMDTAKSQALSHALSFPLLYDKATTAIRRVGLWSDQMDMPFMGYVIVDKSERIVAGDPILSEIEGDAPKNVDLMLAALSRIQATEAASPAPVTPAESTALRTTDAHGESGAETVTGSAITVEMTGNQFVPQGIKVTIGTTVTWVNRDEVVHNVRQIEDVFLSPDTVEPGQSFSYTFQSPGTFRYVCTFHHPTMNGVVIVEKR